MIGDLHTVALVGTDGTIDWYCCPRFDSPSVFASILDADKGGFFRIAPAHADVRHEAALLPRHERPDHALPDAATASARCRTSCRSTATREHRRQLIRRVIARARRDDASCSSASRASTTAARPHTSSMRRARRGVPARRDLRAGARDGDRRSSRDGDGVAARVHAQRRRDAQTFVPRAGAPDEHAAAPSPTPRPRERVRRTPSRYWRGWLRHSRYRGRWREMVHRSALTLKLLTYAPDRRDRRRADHQPARAARRRAQLGLPLHLDPRRRVLALRAAAARLHRGGRGVHATG